MKAMIFAAGLGTRLRPITDTVPKALVPVGGVPMLERVITKVRDAGISGIVVNAHHFSEKIEDFLRNNDVLHHRLCLLTKRSINPTKIRSLTSTAIRI